MMKRILFAFMVMCLRFTCSIFFFLLFGYSLAIAHPISNSCFEKDVKLEKGIRRPPGAKELRLNELFIIGEKAVGFGSKKQQNDRALITEEGKIYGGIRKVRNFGIINAFSILDVKLRDQNWIIPILKEKKYNVLLVAELKKKGEDTWNRISVVNRYTWEIKKSTHAEEMAQRTEEKKKRIKGKADPNVTSEGKRIRPFYVVDETLSDNPFLREGDKVVALFFYDVKRPTTVYLDDLKETQKMGRSFMTIDAQKMYLITSGSSPQEYSAKDGDEIRLRFMRAEYSIKRKKEVEDSLAENKEPLPPAKYGDIVNVEDEMHFIFKEFGIKLNVSPVIVFGSPTNSLDIDDFNPTSKTASLGSNVYLSYDGISKFKNVLFNYLLPGMHVSLLGLKEQKETNFTLGIIFPLIPNVLSPNLRRYFGVFLGWHNLKDRVIGITFSPAIDFSKLLRTDERK